jgi:hypothetical protein
MIDRDVAHAMLQFTSTVVLIMCGVVMIMIWQATRHRHIEANPQLKLLLAFLLLTVGFKQGFWLIQGALIAADLFGSAALFSSHWLPPVLNGTIGVIGLAMMAYLGSASLGIVSYATAGGVGAVLMLVGWLLPRF